MWHSRTHACAVVNSPAFANQIEALLMVAVDLHVNEVYVCAIHSCPVMCVHCRHTDTTYALPSHAKTRLLEQRATGDIIRPTSHVDSLQAYCERRLVTLPECHMLLC